MIESPDGLGQKVVTLVEGEIGFIIGRNPPVNALSTPVRAGLMSALAALTEDPLVEAIVVLGEGRTFFAGGDIAEFGPDMPPPGLEEVAAAYIASPKPIVAAIHGYALGGGLEVAMSCGYRIVTPDAKVGLPEINVGILAGAGGVQLLSRLAGPEAALDLALSGRHVAAPEALAMGIVDEVAAGEPKASAVAFARRILKSGQHSVPIPLRDEKLVAARADPTRFEALARTLTAPLAGQLASAAIVDAVRRSISMPFAQALAADIEASYHLLLGAQSRALRYLFFAERAAAKRGNLPGREQIMVERMKAPGFVGTLRLAVMANEGARLVSEGVALRASEVDVALVRAGAWPRHEGGPMFQADEFGLTLIVAELERMAAADASLKPVDLLVRTAGSGGRLTGPV